jgi:hypothetical protein
MLEARRADHWELLAAVKADAAEPEIALAEPIAGGTALRIVAAEGRARSSSSRPISGRVSNRAYKRQGQTMATATEIFDDVELAEDIAQDLLLSRHEMKERTTRRGPAGGTGGGGRHGRPAI